MQRTPKQQLGSESRTRTRVADHMSVARVRYCLLCLSTGHQARELVSPDIRRMRRRLPRAPRVLD